MSKSGSSFNNNNNILTDYKTDIKSHGFIHFDKMCKKVNMNLKLVFLISLYFLLAASSCESRPPKGAETQVLYEGLCAEGLAIAKDYLGSKSIKFWYIAEKKQLLVEKNFLATQNSPLIFFNLMAQLKNSGVRVNAMMPAEEFEAYQQTVKESEKKLSDDANHTAYAIPIATRPDKAILLSLTP